MSVNRIHKDKNFTVLSNAAIRDKTLSFRARGVLAFALSHSDGFEATATWLTAASDKDGREAVRTALRELEKAGYRRKRTYQNPSGQWITEIDWYESPRTGNP